MASNTLTLLSQKALTWFATRLHKWEKRHVRLTGITSFVIARTRVFRSRNKHCGTQAGITSLPSRKKKKDLLVSLLWLLLSLNLTRSWMNFFFPSHYPSERDRPEKNCLSVGNGWSHRAMELTQIPHDLPPLLLSPSSWLLPWESLAGSLLGLRVELKYRHHLGSFIWINDQTFPLCLTHLQFYWGRDSAVTGFRQRTWQSF